MGRFIYITRTIETRSAQGDTPKLISGVRFEISEGFFSYYEKFKHQFGLDSK